MSLDRKRFEENLKKGIAAEELVSKYLRRTYEGVEDSRQQTHSSGGPKIIGTAGSIILPDFVVYDKIVDGVATVKFAVDAKLKETIYPIDGQRVFTVDNKYEQYLKAIKLKNLDYLAFIFVHNGKMYFYKESERWKTKAFNNEFSTGDSLLFIFDASKEVK